MSNSTPLGRDRRRESVDTLTEESLAALGEQRIVLGRLERAQKNIEALQAARGIERERLVAHIARCKADLRGAEEDLERFDEIDAHCQALNVEQMEIVVEAEQQISEDQRVVSAAAKNAGFAYTRNELIEKGATALLDRRRRVREAGATPAESEAI